MQIKWEDQAGEIHTENNVTTFRGQILLDDGSLMIVINGTRIYNVKMFWVL